MNETPVGRVGWVSRNQSIGGELSRRSPPTDLAAAGEAAGRESNMQPRVAATRPLHQLGPRRRSLITPPGSTTHIIRTQSAIAGPNRRTESEQTRVHSQAQFCWPIPCPVMEQRRLGRTGPAAPQRPRAKLISRSSIRPPSARSPLCSYSLVSQVRMVGISSAVSSEKDRSTYMSLA